MLLQEMASLLSHSDTKHPRGQKPLCPLPAPPRWVGGQRRLRVRPPVRSAWVSPICVPDTTAGGGVHVLQDKGLGAPLRPTGRAGTPTLAVPSRMSHGRVLAREDSRLPAQFFKEEIITNDPLGVLEPVYPCRKLSRHRGEARELGGAFLNMSRLCLNKYVKNYKPPVTDGEPELAS